MRRVRLAQQEKAQKQAQEAANENKEKEREKKLKKNLAVSSTTSNKKDDGDTLGRSTGYNPLNPSSGSTCGYRPGRKGPSTRRG